jgi:DNA-binding XRE family transcriptional regulator
MARTQEEARLMTEQKFWAALGQRVRDFRLAADRTQEWLAEEIGYSRVSVVNLEAGRQQMPLYVLYCVAYALGVRLWEILPDD